MSYHRYANAVSSARSKNRAPRRSSAEIRRLLLDAARGLFEEQGYQATTTQQIVERARVDAPTLYRHFPSKADLFEAAALSSLKDCLDRRLEYWRVTPRGVGDPEARMRHFIGGFFSEIEAHRESFRLLMASSSEDGLLGELARTISRQFREGLLALREVLVEESRAQGWSVASPDAVIGAATGMMVSMALFEDWVFPEGACPSREALIDELTMIMLHGVVYRPSSRRVEDGASS
jgi:AcrR family transcriptional regulator